MWRTPSDPPGKMICNPDACDGFRRAGDLLEMIQQFDAEAEVRHAGFATRSSVFGAEEGI